jgi:hypothetical protein
VSFDRRPEDGLDFRQSVRLGGLQGGAEIPEQDVERVPAHPGALDDVRHGEPTADFENRSRGSIDGGPSLASNPVVSAGSPIPTTSHWHNN